MWPVSRAIGIEQSYANRVGAYARMDAVDVMHEILMKAIISPSRGEPLSDVAHRMGLMTRRLRHA